MKRWILPASCAVIFHAALFKLDLVSLPPVMAMHENRTVTISLVQMPPPQPKKQIQPLAMDSSKPIAPLAKLTPKTPPVVRPEPQPKPEPVNSEALQEPGASDVAPLQSTSVKGSDAHTLLDSDSAAADLQAPGPDQAEVQASIPLYHLNPPPAYPAAARRRNYQGTVLLNVLVDRQGQVEQVKVAHSCGYDMLDRSAAKSVRQWRFEPARRFGRPFEMWVQVPIKFELK
jgi:protein TonB